MKEHTTHFDDCGCKSEKYEGEIRALKSNLERAEGVLREIVHMRDESVKCWGRLTPLALMDCAKLASGYFKGKGE